jgi:hypothetical protein
MNRIVVLLAVVVAAACMSCHRATREEQCLEMVKHEKRRLPRNVTKGIILDSILYETKSQTLVYYHTMSDSVYTDEMIDYGKAELQRGIQQDIVNSVSLKRLKDEGISFRYVYMGSDTKRVRLELDFKNENL